MRGARIGYWADWPLSKWIKTMAARRTRRAENREVAEAADFELRRRAIDRTPYTNEAGDTVWPDTDAPQHP